MKKILPEQIPKPQVKGPRTLAMNTTMRPAAIFWDMDGTMVDSEPLWGIATYELSEKLGRRLGEKEREKTVGGSFPNTLEVCARHAGIDPATLDAEAIAKEFFARVAEIFHGNLHPRPGVRQLLAELAAEQTPMFVTTNTIRSLADPAIEAVGEHFFQGSVTGDDVANPKPHPEIYLKAAQLAGADPADCLVFEDSVAGQTAAMKAGCRVISLPENQARDQVKGTTYLGDLRGDGSIEFAGVRAQDVYRWFRQA